MKGMLVGQGLPGQGPAARRQVLRAQRHVRRDQRARVPDQPRYLYVDNVPSGSYSDPDQPRTRTAPPRTRGWSAACSRTSSISSRSGPRSWARARRSTTGACCAPRRSAATNGLSRRPSARPGAAIRGFKLAKQNAPLRPRRHRGAGPHAEGAAVRAGDQAAAGHHEPRVRRAAERLRDQTRRRVARCTRAARARARARARAAAPRPDRTPIGSSW